MAKAVLTGRFGQKQRYSYLVRHLAHSLPEGASAMRVVLIIAVLLLVAVSAAAVVSVAEPIRQYLPPATLALAILVLIGVFSQKRQTIAPANARGRTGPPGAGAASSEQCRRRNRPLPGDAARKGAAGRFPDGRYQRL